MISIKGYDANLKKIEVFIKDNKIFKINYLKSEEKIKKRYIIPGFIELHSHGGYGFDFVSADQKKMLFFLNKLAVKEGTTSICGTTITTDFEKMRKTFRNLSPYIDKKINGANFIGWHMEGPFISKIKKGAHPEDKIIDPIILNVNKYLKDYFSKIKIITLAPELTSKQTLLYLKNKNIIISAGHMNANKKEFMEKEKYGIKSITHFNNAMQKNDDKNDNSLSEYILKNDDLYIEFINDRIHNSKELANKIYNKKAENKIMLVTDSLQIKGLKNGIYSGPNGNIIKRNNAAWFENKTLNGSCYSMHKGFIDWIKYQKASIQEAIDVTSKNQARLLNLKKGVIKEGYDADILILNSKFNIKEVYVMGDKVLENKWK
ncbi:/ nagA_2 / N-acetylglucosamine-6-phosphate deacetylase / 5566:6681 Forward [Candidatus Hepatoplasma crinochetorum]|uniref:/ nagA_2 / N-acetylglucosamine-6-phosphate deacetylase / 5566:6681 Forward n=1 Tax=Candidatus Hepatoplasma crinochetorum TaxID=295596 RepID=A0A0G7ZNI0_9MOLU|nr:/ nagA_2 / N-acetylglucosamine-6-phosphate deacetylase / 5566:6681 Forward [Candidatus Hepatoplasma crinochetorum]